MKLNKYYWRFAGYSFVFQLLVTGLAFLFDSSTNIGAFIATIVPASVVVQNFIKDNDRTPSLDEAIALSNVSLLITWIISILYPILGILIMAFYLAGLEGVLFVITSPLMAFNLIFEESIPQGLGKIFLVVCLILSVIFYVIYRYMYGRYAMRVYKKLQKK